MHDRQSVFLHIYSTFPLCCLIPDMIPFMSFESLHSFIFINLLFIIVNFFFLASSSSSWLSTSLHPSVPDYLSILYLPVISIFMPICPLFVSHLCVCSSGSEPCLALTQYDVCAERTNTGTSYYLCI